MRFIDSDLPSHNRRRWLLMAALAVFTSVLPRYCVAAEREANAASAARLYESVKFLSSDELEGRGIGTEGLDKAATYIAEQFRDIGLKTDVFNGSPFQTFTINASPELGSNDQNRLMLLGPGGEGEATTELPLELGKDFNPLAIGGSGRIEAPLVFVGYGITAPEHQYDDYEGLDVRGKVVVILRKEPRQETDGDEFNGKHPSKHALFTTKVENAVNHGAAAIIFVNDHYELVTKRSSARETWQKAVQQLAEAVQEFQEANDDSPEAFQKHREQIQTLIEQIQESAKTLDSDPDTLLGFDQAGDVAHHENVPIFFCRREVIDPIVQNSLGLSLAEIEKKIDENLTPRSGLLEHWTVKGEAHIVRRKVKIKNVAAVLEGEGPYADETIVIGAHYDHLGLGGPGSLAPWTREIHNGADDNASGTAALLEVARRLAAHDKKPRRRILFIAFTGEERGLLGSAHYVKNPAFPLEKTVAMINMDMVGRLDDNKLVVYGVGTAEGFESLIDRLNETHGFRITKNESGYGPSDHTSFYTKGIPVMHLFTGTHSDYHRPSDDYDKINVEGLRRVTDFVVDITLAISDNRERPKYLETQRPQTANRGQWPYFGSVPDYASDAKGLKLQDVAKNGPAAKAGLKGGDIIIEFGGQAITGIEDFANALSKHKGGDRVIVKALRDGAEISVEVTLEAPR